MREWGEFDSSQRLFASIKKESVLVLERLQTGGSECNVLIRSMIDFSIPPKPIQETARLYLKTVLSAFGFGFIEQCKNLSADVSREMKRIFRNALRDPDQWVGRIASSDPVVLVRGLGYRSVAVLSKNNKTK
jgi:hypothetical protein